MLYALWRPQAAFNPWGPTCRFTAIDANGTTHVRHQI
jgi:hypothetical protein